MASRVISIDLVGNNASAKRAIAEVGTTSEKAAAKSTAAFTASTSKIGGAFSKLGNAGAAIGIPFANSLSLVGTQLEKTGAKGKTFGSTLSRIGGVEAAAGAAGLAIFGAAAVRAATADEHSQKLLATALKSTTGATDSQIASTEKWITKQQNSTGIIDDELRPALGALLRATGDQAKSQDLLTIAMDASVATGKPLQTISIALGRAYLGNTASLGRLGIQTKDASGKALTFSQIIGTLAQKTGGAAAAGADTLQGKLNILKGRFEDIEENVGAALIPKLETAAGAAVSVAHGFSTANAATGGLLGKAVLIGAAVPVVAFAFDKAKVALGAFTVSEEAAAAGAGVLGTSMSGLGVAAIGAVAGIGSFTATKGILNHFVSGTKPDVDELTTSFEGLANTQKVDGAAADIFGQHLEDLAGSLRTVKGNTLQKGFGLSESSHQAVKDIDAVNEALTNILKTKGVSAAGAAFREVSDALKEQGISVDVINQELGPFLVAMGKAPALARDNAAASGQASRATVEWGNATKGTKEAQDELAKSLKSLNDDLLASQNADLALAEANNQVGQALIAATQATRENGTASQAAVSAQFSLEHAILGAVSAAEAEAEATDKAKIAHGQNVSAIQIENDKHRAAVAELAILKSQYPELASLIDRYRLSLDLIPKTVNTVVSTTFTGNANVIAFQHPGGRAKGGFIGGTGSGDIVPALLEPGEFVMQKKAVNRIGPHAMAAMNAGAVPRFAGGGPVGRVSFSRSVAGGDVHVHLHGDVYGDADDLIERVIQGLRKRTNRNASIQGINV
jgi:hypothetical protein